MSAHNINLSLVFSDARRVINANRRHFMTLSLLFVLPQSAIVYSSFSKPISFTSTYSRSFSSSFKPLLPESETPPAHKSTDSISTLVISSLFLIIFSLSSIASVTSSILNGFFGETVNLASSLKCIMVSFFPLTATHIVSMMILGLIVFTVAGLAGIIYATGGILFGAGIDFRGVYLLGFIILLVVLLTGVFIYLQLKWYLADVIVVVESKWGFAPLTRSCYLIQGTKTVAFSISVLFAVLPAIMSLLFSSSMPTPVIGGSVISWKISLPCVAIATMLRVYSIAATAVLFIYCKGLRGELAAETADEVALRLIPYNDGYGKKEHKVVV
ncbi:hypothetical protein F511_22596 [Dorcoceras hygrometricum]|uniref:Transmembrane protein n=1 Tax=Dorcoceras hygrometricum TaxID=472368 RepID=A0A2Z7BFX2_9LAMI|nr:hypothetical protein F511_22596 [Dorcoceras hygrometricum]